MLPGDLCTTKFFYMHHFAIFFYKYNKRKLTEVLVCGEAGNSFGVVFIIRNFTVVAR